MTNANEMAQKGFDTEMKSLLKITFLQSARDSMRLRTLMQCATLSVRGLITMAKKVGHLPNCAVEEVMDKVANDLLCADKLGKGE